VVSVMCTAVNPTDPLPDHLFVPPGSVPAGLVLRLVTAADLPQLYRALYADQPYTQFQMRFQRLLARQQNQGCFWMVAELQSALVGNGQLLLYPSGAELANLRVVEAFQNQNIGTAMIQVLTEIAIYIGLDSLEIGVAEDNQRALALYVSLGFAADRRLDLAGREPAIILRKTL
jgi:ribosomal protein S18 acetylase RimI-like enzyme